MCLKKLREKEKKLDVCLGSQGIRDNCKNR